MTTKTITYPNAFSTITAEEIQQQLNFKAINVVSTITRITITVKLLKTDCYKLYALHEKITSNINYSVSEVKIINSAFSELYTHSDFDKYSVVNPACCFEVSESRCDKGITTIQMTYVNPLAINQNDKTDNNTNKNGKTDVEKKAFIKSAKAADKIKLITHLSVASTVYDDDKELTKVFVQPQIHSDFVQFTNDINPVDLLTREYNTDAEEKKAVQKLLISFVKSYRNKTKDVHQSLTHSNVQVCITVENDKYIVLKKFNLTIFDIVKIDGLNALHTALEKSLLLSSQDTTSANYVTEIIAEINRKIIAADNKPIIRNIREFKKLLYSCRGKATAKRCTYNQSNVTNFISGYVLAAYNNRLPKYTAILKPSKNK